MKKNLMQRLGIGLVGLAAAVSSVGCWTSRNESLDYRMADSVNNTAYFKSDNNLTVGYEDTHKQYNENVEQKNDSDNKGFKYIFMPGETSDLDVVKIALRDSNNEKELKNWERFVSYAKANGAQYDPDEYFLTITPKFKDERLFRFYRDTAIMKEINGDGKITPEEINYIEKHSASAYAELNGGEYKDPEEEKEKITDKIVEPFFGKVFDAYLMHQFRDLNKATNQTLIRPFENIEKSSEEEDSCDNK